MRADNRVVEVRDGGERLHRIAADYCRASDGALVISPANRERTEINRLVHGELRAAGRLTGDDYRTRVLVARNDMTGTERTFAGAYLPGEDIIRFNRASKTYGVVVGDHARAVAADRGENTLTVRLADGRELTL